MSRVVENSSPVGSYPGISHFLHFPGAGLLKIQVLWEVTLAYLISCIFYEQGCWKFKSCGKLHWHISFPAFSRSRVVENSSPVGSYTGISHFLHFPGAGLLKIQVLWEVTLAYLISCILYSTFKVFIPWLRLLLLSCTRLTPLNESNRVDFLPVHEDVAVHSGIVVKALRYKPVGCGFDSWWCHWNFSVT